VMAKHAVLSSDTHLWRSMTCPKSELRLDLTLACGQSFRWRETAEHHWTGVMGGRVWTLTQTDDTLWYHVYTTEGRQTCGSRKRTAAVSLQEEKSPTKKVKAEVEMEEEPVAVTSAQGHEEEEEMLRDYFQLGVNMGDLRRQWGSADTHFKQIADIFTGVRMLRQDPTECLFSIICTTNNQISRVQDMVESLCQALGAPLCHLEQTPYHDFPSLTALADSNVEACLRGRSFGYRARYLQKSAKQILETHGPQWLEDLRHVPYLEAHDALRTLPGVGSKVADCVCLMSLDKTDAVPIDTHMWQIAKRDYKYPDNGQKSITDKLYRHIGDFFRNKWGPYAGWAQSVLFCADLKKFKKLKEAPHPLQLKKDKDAFKEEKSTPGNKTKIKVEKNGSVKHTKTKSDCSKTATMPVKNEKVG
uniref:N-glycosylase/DNA lyase n=2 Tax=Echeneis naucrates TaxID=173247 RepID=A0A665T5T6_ECHNA